MIQRDKTHAEQIERWANYVKTNPGWKKEHKQFIDAQIIMAQRALMELSKTSQGREKILQLKRLKMEKE